MTDYKELISDLRDEDQANWKRLSLDAAAAIEALQAEIRESMQKCAECGDANMPKRGEWIGKSDDDSLVKCSVCGHIRIGSSLWYCKQYVPYCENCGAKMEVQE